MLVRLLAVSSFLIFAGTASASISDGTVRILVLTNLEGIYSELAGQGSVIATEMAVEEAGNRAAGSRVEIVVADSKLDAETAARRLAEIHQRTPVDMVIGPISSGVALAVLGAAKERGILTLHSGPSSTAFTNEACSPLSIQWGFDTYALTRSSATAAVAQGGDRWYFLTADYEFGHNLERQASAAVTDAGGEVAGSSLVSHPATAEDMAGALQTALNSGANIIGLANAGDDTQLAIRQFYEAGAAEDEIGLMAMEVYITDVQHLGLYVMGGTSYATSFYWNRDDTSRRWSEAFRARHGAMPTSPQAGIYSAVRHYLRAVDAAGSDNGTTVAGQMRRMTVDDGVFTASGSIRPDGRMLHDMMLARVKAPSAMRRQQDYLEVLRTIPAEEAFQPMAAGSCNLAN